MVRYFILIKRKNAKRFLGAIPARKGISLVELRKSARTQIRPGLQFKIVTETQLKKMLPRLLRKPKGVGLKRKRTVKKKRIVRKKTTRRRRKR